MKFILHLDVMDALLLAVVALMLLAIGGVYLWRWIRGGRDDEA